MANLILTRKKNERIILGNGFVTITVVDIRGDKVRIGIEAPRELSVHREEVEEAIRRKELRNLAEPPDGP